MRFYLDHTQLSHDDVILPSMMKKEPRGAHPNPPHEVYDVDTDFVFVIFKDRYNDVIIYLKPKLSG